jgi:hypothetical protein
MAADGKATAMQATSGTTGMVALDRAISAEKEIRQHSPKFFDAAQYRTLSALCGSILPADENCDGAIEAGAPEFVDLLASENQKTGATLLSGLQAIDAICVSRYGSSYMECAPIHQISVLDLVAYRESAETDESLQAAITGFALLRRLAVGAFFTSKIGIEYLQYIGNAYLKEFPGCAVPEGWPGPAVTR